MLTRHIKPGGPRVLQLGGTTRDLFYYPKGTIQITVAGEDLKVGLWEQSGMQCGIPVKGIKTDANSTLKSSAGAVYDAVVVFDQLAGISNMQAFLGEVFRVLKPGGTFVFMERTAGSPVAPLIRLGGPPAAGIHHFLVNYRCFMSHIYVSIHQL